jgi:hypothetical protein
LDVLKASEEKLEEKYALKAKGYGCERTLERVVEVLGMAPEAVTAFEGGARFNFGPCIATADATDVGDSLAAIKKIFSNPADDASNQVPRF